MTSVHLEHHQKGGVQSGRTTEVAGVSSSPHPGPVPHLGVVVWVVLLIRLLLSLLKRTKLVIY